MHSLDTGLFRVIGGQKVGLKAQDLTNHRTLLEESGFRVLGGDVIAVEVFQRFLDENGFDESTSQEAILAAKPTKEIEDINYTLSQSMSTEQPYAIRSSSCSERGGTGIYKTTFFVSHGDEKDALQKLWECEREVYASEFSKDAILWREKTNATIGIAVLVQPVQGFQFDDYYLPALAGTAYTSYNGLMTVRTVIGLGSRAVDGEGVVLYHAPSNHWLYFDREMWDQENADAFDLATGELVSIHHTYEEVHDAMHRGFDSFCKLFAMLQEIKQGSDLYIEWVITDDGIVVVQCADYTDSLPGDMTIDASKYFLLAQGSDVLHSGRATCKYVVKVGYWASLEAGTLAHLNQHLKDYLLIIPQDAISRLADCQKDFDGNSNKRLNFRHFSNANAIIERQWDYSREQRRRMVQVGMSAAEHTDGRGASHFQQLCKRSDILFIGTKLDSSGLYNIRGGVRYKDDVDITVWQVDAEVLVDAVNKEGFVYVAKEAEVMTYTPGQVEDWSMKLRTAANWLSDPKNTQEEWLPDQRREELSKHFYLAHYAIAPSEATGVFDPYQLDPIILEEAGLDNVIASIKAVADEGEDFLYPAWGSGLGRYLRDLYQHLTK